MMIPVLKKPETNNKEIRKMKITILCVGKLKEEYFRKACDEYLKRLSRYAKCEVIEVADEKTPENALESVERAIKEKEGERLLAKWDDSAFNFVLAIEGKQRSSTDFSVELENIMLNGKSNICFVIGGSLGLSDAVIKKADSLLSFSKMTFPHQLMRVVLLEQVYRAFRIMKNEPYHK